MKIRNERERGQREVDAVVSRRRESWVGSKCNQQQSLSFQAHCLSLPVLLEVSTLHCALSEKPGWYKKKSEVSALDGYVVISEQLCLK